jgi:ankyrin repeat protein
MVKCLARELGADVNHSGGVKQTTPLHIAIILGSLPMVRCLVKEVGANVDLAPGDLITSLGIAAQLGKLDVVQCLVKELGADVNLAPKDEITPLMISAIFKNHKITRYILKHGADPQAKHSIAAATRLRECLSATALLSRR